MIAIIGAGVFSIVIVLSFLIVCGFPLGELTMGGLIPLWFSENVTKMICIIMAVYHDTAFCNFSSMFLDNHTVKNIKNLICKGDYHVSQYSRNIWITV